MVTAIVGANWGDEGKGKMTDLFAEKAGIVVRFQGGANAGHTIINEYGKFALHILPSGVFRRNVTNVIGQGVALNPIAFFKELDELSQRGVPAPTILISDRVQLLLSYHVCLDGMEEERLGAKSFGSTRSGIAPFYSDKYLKIGIQACEIYDDEHLKARLEAICEVKNRVIESVYHRDPLSPDALFEEIASWRDRLHPYLTDTALYLNYAIKDKKNILLEGQLGSLRDPDNGIYPFTTSSSPLAGFASVGAGIPPMEIKRIISIVKAYSTCVGAGAFVSEIFGEEADTLRNRGGDNGEFGATTGRPRRMGWFDAVATKYGCMMQGTTDIALSLIDVLGYMKKIPVCVAYEIDGIKTTDFPCTPQLDKAKPVYEYLDGWNCDIRGVRKYEDLPENARKFVEFIEKFTGYPVSYISNGSKRDEIILRKPI